MRGVAAFPRVLIRQPRHRGVTARPRLSAREARGRATVITGPAGSGKSVLAAQLADGIGGRVAWCRFAPGWGRGVELPAMMAASLDALGPDIGDDLLAAASQILEMLEAGSTSLVVDDLHECHDGDVERLLAEVISFLPESAALIVVSRRRPTELIGLAGGAVSVIDENDLAFDGDEAAALFVARGLGRVEADAAREETAGWAVALAASVDAADDPMKTIGSVIADTFLPERLGPLSPLAEGLAALPSLGVDLAESLGFGGEAEFEALAQRSSLVSRVGDEWRLHASAAEVVRDRLGPERVAAIRAEAAPLIAAGGDAATAIELSIEAGRPELAGRLLAGHASEVGAARATRWLYRLPADVRRNLPPVLAAGRATVNVSLAVETARQRLESATDDRARREALLGLGSLQLAEGELGAAASSLEASLRVAGDDDRFRRVVGEQLAFARWLAGDGVGALAAAEDLDSHVWTEWIRAAVAFSAEDLETAGRHAELCVAVAAGEDDTVAPGRSMTAAIALANDGPDAAAADAAIAYQVAVVVGGRDLAVAGPVHAWVCLRRGDIEEATSVTDQIERAVGRQDAYARLQCALLRRGIARVDDAEIDSGRAERRVRDLRTRGFAVVEDFVARLMGDERTPRDDGLEVRLLDSFDISVDGRPIERSGWKSKKALEVCAFLARAGAGGLRREQVIEAVWPDRDPDKGRTLLRTALSEVRRVLEPGRAAGQESRFVTTADDRVIIAGRTDLAEAAALRTAGDHAAAYLMFRAGPAAELPDSDWVEELRGVVAREAVETATRVVDDGASRDIVVSAYETLIAAEPWQRRHYDELAATHRSGGDELAAADIERRWFTEG
jgi:DNA-binding SARP family transcriptional activator